MIRRAVLTGAFLLASLVPGAHAERLSGDVVSTHYEISLSPDLGSGNIEGSDQIDLRIVRPTKALVPNSVGSAFP